MEKKVVKRKINYYKLATLLFILGLFFLVSFKLVNGTFLKKITLKDAYLASSDSFIELFKNDNDRGMYSDLKKVRGLLVKTNYDELVLDNKKYIMVYVDDDEYYALEENLVDNKKDVVLEKEKYVRTSVTIYKNSTDSKILSYMKKGNKFEIEDYDFIDDDGNVNMYKIKYEDTYGWVYGKYLVDSLDEANLNYNENGVYDIHKDRKFYKELYGGSASTLDYYPYQKVYFDDNPLLENAKAMYLNAGSGVISNIDKYLEIAVNNGVNAIVVDIKDGALAYTSEVAKEYSTTAYNTAINDNKVYKSAIDKIKKAGIYAIGRIVVFNDSHFGKDHPEECIKSTVSSRLWPSAYSRLAWEYNVELALEAVDLMGFNEIQFDYVRFPEDSYNMSKNGQSDFRNKYNEEKAEAVQNFLFYATDQLHKKNVYLSVDVFGECSSTYVTSYGQYWPAISNIVDVISSMPYTDHFGRETDTWSNAYQTVKNWAQGAATRQNEIPTPAVPRTWITAYDTPYWNPTVVYGASKISDQAQALVDSGLKGGFITWNSASSLNKYEQIKSAFAKDYK